MNATFAIVTPVYDGWPHLRNAALSVEAQRREGVTVRHIVQMHSDSPPQSATWLLQRAGNAELYQEDDAGLYDAIARGFARTNASAFLGWLNADEQYLPDALERVALYFERHPETDIVFGDYLLLDEACHPIAARREIPARLWYLRHGVNYILSCATFFRRRVWETLGGFDPAYHRVADKEFYLRALSRGFRFAHLPEYLGAFTLTGRNRSADALGLVEPITLRRQVNAYPWLALRALPRLCRVAEKMLRGCYRRELVTTRLFDLEGQSVRIEARLGSRWRKG